MNKIKTLFLISFFISSYFIAAQGVSINDDGSSANNSAMLDVKSTSKGFLPPRMNTAQRDSISIPEEGLLIYNSEVHQWQGFNGSNWVNTNGTDCSPLAPSTISGSTTVPSNTIDEVYSIDAVANASTYHWLVPSDATIVSGQGTTSITVDYGYSSGNISVRAESGCDTTTYTNVSVSVIPQIGDYYAGGVVFYSDGIGGGLVCAVTNQIDGVEWGCYETEITGADGSAIGTGAQNTVDIVADCPADDIAADICADLILNGYDDWFLPSKDELHEMYLNKATIDSTAAANGGTGLGYFDYWCSTEINLYYAWREGFYSGGSITGIKWDNSLSVRAVRAF